MRKQVWIWLIIALSMGLGACHNWGRRVQGNGNIRTEERTVGNFRNVSVRGSANVYVSQEDRHTVKIEGDENLLKYIEVEQEGDKIIVRNRPGYNLVSTGDIRIYVAAPVLNDIDVSGSCSIIGQTKISNPDNLELHVSGAGDIEMEVDVPRLKAEVSGSGNINLKGQTRDVDLDLTGAGHAHCYDLLAENTKVDISGAGSADVYASVKLDAQVSGAGSVNYKGNAANVNQHVSGAGSITKVP
jgi:hypothetical protein